MALAGPSAPSLAARGDQAGTSGAPRIHNALRGCSAVAVRRPQRLSVSASLASGNGGSAEARRCVVMQSRALGDLRRRRPDLSVAAAPALAGGEYSESEAPASTEEPVGVFGFPQRWILVAAASLAFVLCNMDKVNMSVALIPMAKEFGWSGADKGVVSSAFFWGYAMTQVPGGYIAGRLGGGKVLSAGVALWSFGTLLGPPAAAMGLPMLCLSRWLVGLGEGVAPSAATALLVSYIPASARARAVSLVWGGLDLGSVVGLLIAPSIISTVGWQAVFYIFAVLGFLWCAAWPFLHPSDAARVTPPPARSSGGSSSSAAAASSSAAAAASAPSTPEAAPAPSTSGRKPPPPAPAQNAAQWIERNRIRKSATAAGAKAPSKSPPWGHFFRTPAVWAVICTHFCFNYGYYTLLAWLPSYFSGALKMDLAMSSALSLLPYVAMVVMTPLVGPVADSLVDRGFTITRVRKLAQGVAFLGPALCMLLLAAITPGPALPLGLSGTSVVPNIAFVIVVMSVAFSLGAWSRAGLYCNHQDLSPKYASLLLGVSNTAGAMPGVLGVWAAGVLLDATGSWSLALFLPTMAAQLFGLVVFTIFGSGERQKFDEM